MSDTEALPEPVSPSETAAPSARPRTLGPALTAAAAVLVFAVVAIGATPFWAPVVIGLLPWGAEQAKPAPAPAPAPTAPDPALAALRTQAAQNAAVLQTLSQQVAALAAKPPPDLAPLREQIAALGATVGDLSEKVASLGDLSQRVASLAKAAQAEKTAPTDETALALVLLQIHAAVAVGRPFDAEYRTLAALARNHPEITAAAAPLAEQATTGVPSSTALISRLHELAPRITNAAPPPKPGWRSQLVAQLRSLVTIRRLDGAGQSPAEATVATAERDLAGGDLDGAVAVLSGLSGPKLAAAQPWLAMARQRLAAEAALRQIAALVTAGLGGSTPEKPG